MFCVTVDPSEFSHSSDRKKMKKIFWVSILILSVIVYGSHAPLIYLCKVDGEIPFSSSSVVLLIEVAKFMVSFVLLLIYDLNSLKVSLTWRLAVPYAVPALLYCANNNLVIYIQHFMDPTSFQVLSNLKIVSTALLYSLFLHQRLTVRKWFSVCLLMFAGVFYGYGGINDQGMVHTDTGMYVTLPGLILMVIYCLISGMSAVYTEITLKAQKIPLSIQNLFLYSFGIVINFTVHVSNTKNSGLFSAYSIWVCIIIITQAFNGLIMSVVMKHSNNITRLFIISFSMLCNGILSFILFQIQLTALFFLAVVLIGLSVYLYYGVK
ncbi:hypothetical protein GDO86_005348 [Hymenochirus boettgeri]|uniref:UDP-sugar transporter protein SLC35A4 n=1 Tax=Hymenochirus boettgeri TaxID=247094 RepID=A0A8T2J6Z7_9PIPI|nr:hypothetical protein GDO86_005348 [Hymenochirus boettgeri]